MTAYPSHGQASVFGTCGGAQLHSELAHISFASAVGDVSFPSFAASCLNHRQIRPASKTDSISDWIRSWTFVEFQFPSAAEVHQR